MDVELLRRSLDELSEGVCFLDEKGTILYWNKKAEELTGFVKEEVLDKTCGKDNLVHVDDKGATLCRSGCPWVLALNDKKPKKVNVFFHHKKGQKIPVCLRVTPLSDDDGKPLGTIHIFDDNSDTVALVQQIQKFEYMAMVDPVTKVGNRQYAEVSLNSKLTEFQRQGADFGLMVIDIDNLGKTNEKYGEEVGDRVVKLVGGSIRKRLRPYDTVAQWDGGKFVAIISHVDLGQLCSIGDTLCKRVSESGLIIESGLVQTTISIGATLAQHDDTLETVLERGESILGQSKESGKNRVTIDLEG